MKSPKLTGGRCLCRGCNEYFIGEASFDEHRTGAYGVDRRCMTAEEMHARGMGKDGSGFWVPARHLEAARGRCGRYTQRSNGGEPIPTPGVASVATTAHDIFTPDQCPRFDRCSANICPLDADWRKREHLPKEQVCLWLRERVKPGGEALVTDALPPELAEVVTREAPAIVAAHPLIGKALERATRSGSKLRSGQRLRDLDDAA